MKKILMTLILLTFPAFAQAQMIHAFFKTKLIKVEEQLRPDLEGTVEFWKVVDTDKDTKEVIIYTLIRNHRKLVKCTGEGDKQVCTYKNDENTQALLGSQHLLSHGLTYKQAVKKMWKDHKVDCKKSVNCRYKNPAYDPNDKDSQQYITASVDDAISAIGADKVTEDNLCPKSILLGQKY